MVVRRVKNSSNNSSSNNRIRNSSTNYNDSSNPSFKVRHMLTKPFTKKSKVTLPFPSLSKRRIMPGADNFGFSGFIDFGFRV